MKDTPITSDLVRELCARGEGTRLDFKAAPGYDDWDSKGRYEFIKDLMALANSIPAGDARAYLLLGVTEEGPSRLGKVTGFQPEKHFTDAGLHQTVLGMLNRVPNFRYQAVEVDGLLVGVVEVGSGERPYFPTTDKGRLPKYMAYYREGSINTLASPQQVVEWAREDGGLRLHSLQAEQVEWSMTPDPRLTTDCKSHSSDQVNWDVFISNVGRETFDVVRYWLEYHGSQALADLLSARGTPHLGATMAYFRRPYEPAGLALEPGKREKLRSFSLSLKSCWQMLGIERPEGIPNERTLFHARVIATAVHRSGRSVDTQPAILKWP